MAVPIDAAGNVDVRLLQRELSQALQQDREYKATDTMKKRAITQAKNYDEFRDMVACATLKPVSSAEIDELRQNKRGWAKKNVTAKSGRTSRLTAKEEGGDAAHPVVAAKPAKQAPKPKTTMDLERDWRRLPTNTDARMRYLLSVGMKRCRRLFGIELGAELLEDVIRVLLDSFDAHGSGSSNGDAETEEASAESCHIDAETLLLWLEMLTHSHNFSTLSLAMVARELRQRVVETLTKIEVATEAASIDKAAVIASYTL